MDAPSRPCWKPSCSAPSRVRHPVRLLKKLVSRYALEARKHTSVWAVVGQIYTTYREWNLAACWLGDWETRPDALGWMVTNLVYSLHMRGLTDEADAVSRKLLARGLRDHTSAYHLLFLALSALEQKETPAARELLQGVHLESDKTDDKLFKLAVEQALLVQETPSGDKKAVAKQGRARMERLAPNGGVAERIKKVVSRVNVVIARDSGSRFAWFYGRGLRMPAVPAARRGSRVFIWIAVMVGLNLFRTCSTH